MARHLSPTAQLLRTSRVFSLPPPLPRPATEAKTRFGFRDSDTATLPYPIRQAIATPDSSLCRGDWGLKRPLPIRTTTEASNPSFQITAHDTVEHITDFEPTLNHVRTLEKWQQIGLAVERSDMQHTVTRSPVSAFEDQYDNTVEKPSADRQTSGRPRFPIRWKYSGPWTGNMTDAEFAHFLKKTKAQKAEFEQHLRSYFRSICLRHKSTSAAAESKHTEKMFYTWLANMSEERFVAYMGRNLQDPKTSFVYHIGQYVEEMDGEPWSQDIASEANEVEQNFPTAFEKDLSKFMRQQVKVMRGDKTLQSELNREIRNFLDMPHPPERLNLLASTDFHETAERQDPGPLSTHPSAGLSYLRTNSVLNNHPLLGPQNSRPPVEARVLRPRSVMIRSNARSTLGVAGVATLEPSGHDNDDSVMDIDATKFGGAKIWVTPVHLQIKPDARIDVKVERAGDVPVRIRQGSLRPEFQQTELPRHGRFQQQLDSKPAYGYSNLVGQRSKRSDPHEETVMQVLKNMTRNPKKSEQRE
ncbi:hypothetical protein EJ06DRAFT_534704 [Trichodelitschia bisporula]|uniref:Uncharacterized protein n=1 Tax=Trichodelitschia bisporula TaxID=703511 RepID=A0A6G1HI84_9PEZI|nr:hypothetical protein EJ06DRAFT_534704 [Trichodelitschia bisporula]